MKKKELTALIIKRDYSAEDLSLLENLVHEYPWFELARFLRLKAMHQLGDETFNSELKSAVIFTGDRKRLYHWIYQVDDVNLSGQMFSGPELEFIDSDQESDDQENFQSDIESALGSDESSDADKSVIREKDETEMEDPEIGPSVSLPEIDTLADEQDENPAKSDETAFSEGKNLYDSGESTEDRKPADNESKSNTDIDDSENDDQHNNSKNLIDVFLNSNPGVIRADKETSIAGDISEESVQEDDSIISDTLAKIYVRQGLHAKAIYAYERLSLKYPEKSAYFAAQIEKIKSISNL